MVRPERFELPTTRVEIGGSIQLSYGRNRRIIPHISEDASALDAFISTIFQPQKQLNQLVPQQGFEP